MRVYNHFGIWLSLSGFLMTLTHQVVTWRNITLVTVVSYALGFLSYHLSHTRVTVKKRDSEPNSS